MSFSLTLNAPSTLRFDGSSPNGQKENPMKEQACEVCGMMNMVALANNANLELGKRVYDNPQPADGECECCGKHFLIPQPPVLIGCPATEAQYVALLVKTWRPIFSRSELDRIIGEWIDVCYGEVGTQQAAEMLLGVFKRRQVEEFFGLEAVWSCAECASLDTDSYFKSISWDEEEDDDDPE